MKPSAGKEKFIVTKIEPPVYHILLEVQNDGIKKVDVKYIHECKPHVIAVEPRKTGTIKLEIRSKDQPQPVQFNVFESGTNEPVETDIGSSFTATARLKVHKKVVNTAAPRYYVWVEFRNHGNVDIDVKNTRNGGQYTTPIDSKQTGTVRLNFQSIDLLKRR